MRLIISIVIISTASLTSPMLAGPVESISRCKMEYLRSEKDLRSKEGEFYEACMRSEGYVTVAGFGCYGPSDPPCYRSVAPPEKSPIEKAESWLEWAKQKVK